MTHVLDPTRLGEHEWLFDRRDALLRVRDRSRVSAEMNARRALNMHAPFSPGLSMRLPDDGGAVIDTFFGYAYTGLPAERSAVYGTTEAVQPGPLDVLADGDLGFLRVPFKRIPRIRADDLEDLAEIVGFAAGAFGADKLLFRGQHTEFHLKRSAAFLKRFYGSAEVLEPSLTASATRRQPSIEACMPEFMMILQLWQETSMNSIGGRFEGLEAELFERLAAEVQSIWTEPKFYFQALALAQHYGLPSVGLDVTSDLHVALFFALREFVPRGGQKALYRPVTSAYSPVIYILAREGTREYPFGDSTPTLLRSGRPEKQSAWFMHVGWGLSANAAADQIVAAVYLDASSQYGPIPPAADLFPARGQDSLGSFLSSLNERASEPFRAVLSDLYWIED